MVSKNRLILLFNEGDLRSIPRSARLESVKEIFKRSDSWCDRYLAQRIEPLIRFVEPLCAEDGKHFRHRFAAKCAFRSEMSDFELAVMQVHSGITERDDVDSLYDAVQLWTDIELFDHCSEEDVLDLRLKIATSLRYLNCPSLAVGLWELWLGLKFEDYTIDPLHPDETLKQALTYSHLYRFSSYAQICVITSLAQALAFADERLDTHAVTLVESWLGFFPSAYKSRTACELMLEQTPLIKVDSPHDEALLIATLGQSLCCVDSSIRSKVGAVNLMKAWAGMPESAYSDPSPTSMISAIPHCRFGKINNVHCESLFASILGDTLRGVRLPVDHRVSQSETAGMTGLNSSSNDSPSHLVDLASASRGSLESVAEAQESQIFFDGLQQSLNLMEGWLQVDIRLYQSDNYDALREQLRRSALSQIDFDTQANFVMRFIETLRHTPTRGPFHGGMFLSAWLNLPRNLADSVEVEIPASKVVSFPQIAKITNDQIRINLVCSIASVFRQVDELGARYSAQLLLEYVGVDAIALSDRNIDSIELLNSIKSSEKLKEVDDRSVIHLIETLVKCLKVLPDFGFLRVVPWLCWLLNLNRQVLLDRDCDAAIASFDSCDMHDDQQGTMLIHLAGALETTEDFGFQAAAFVLSTWTGLDPSTFEGDTLACERQFGASRLQRIPSATAGSIISLLGEAWNKQIPAHTKASMNLSLLSLGISPDRFAVSDGSHSATLIVDSLRCANLGNRTNEAFRIQSLCEALSMQGQSERQVALKVLQQWCGESISNIINSRTLQGATLATRISISTVGLCCLERSSEEAYHLAASIVEFVSGVSDEKIEFDWRKDFIERVRKVWAEIKEVGLERSESVGFDLDEVDRVDQQLLSWAEVFENRLLADEANLLITVIEAPSDLCVSDLSPGTSALQGDWNEARLDARKQAWNMGARESPGQASACIHSRETSEHQSKQPQLIRSPKSQLNRLSVLEQKEFRLVDSVPENSVWVRCFFDCRDKLHAWAYTNKGGRLIRLGRVHSSFGSWARLATANLIADAQIELIWHRCANSRMPENDQIDIPIEIEELLFHQMLENYWTKGVFGDEDVDSSADLLREVESNAVFAKHFPNLISLAKCLVSKEHLELLRFDVDVNQKLRKGLESLRDIAGKPGYANDEARNWEVWRKQWLNHTTDQQLDACQVELKLDDLLNGIEQKELAAADVVFQVEGPLLGYPLSWLPFNGKPLFSTVLSTSISVSARLRTLPHRENANGQDPLDLVTATWESPERRPFGAAGLAILEDDVRRYVLREEERVWRHFGLGDNPTATAANLAKVTEELRDSLQMLLVCAHGDENRLGVKLADGDPWLGRGLRIDGCDFLVIAACAMGKLLQTTGRDVEGFLAGLFAQGAKSVLAAKWRIADMETYHFLYDVITSYMRECTANESDEFLRARVLNRARRKYFDSSTKMPDPLFTRHLVMAFDVYGAG